MTVAEPPESQNHHLPRAVKYEGHSESSQNREPVFEWFGLWQHAFRVLWHRPCGTRMRGDCCPERFRCVSLWFFFFFFMDMPEHVGGMLQLLQHANISFPFNCGERCYRSYRMFMEVLL